MVRVAVAGGFDPLHIGHLRHIQEAAKIGEWLIVIVNPDEDLVGKKGFRFMPLAERVEIIRALEAVDEVVVAIDGDGTVAQTLEIIRPDIFAKGGDRTPDNMPQNEIESCERIGCEIRYGVGDKLNSSSEMVRRLSKRSETLCLDIFP